MPVIMSESLQGMIDLESDVEIEVSRIASISLSSRESSTIVKVVVAGIPDADSAISYMQKHAKVMMASRNISFLVTKVLYDTDKATVKLSGPVVNS